MTAKGHVILASPVAFIVATKFHLEIEQIIVFMVISSIGALAPDIDEPGSWIGRRLLFLSWTVKFLSIFFPAFKHRGITHLLAIPIAISAISIFLHNIWIAAFALGWFMHTVGDLITVGGIRGYLYPLFPDKKIVLLPDEFRFYTGGLVEAVIIFCLTGLNGILFFKYFL